MQNSFNRIFIIFSLTVLSLVILFSISSCKKEKTSSAFDMGYDYFPINTGHNVTYQVDSIFYDGFNAGKSDTFHFKVKELIESQFTDLQNRLAQRIERYRKDNDTTDWYIKDVWFSNRTASAVEKVEENVRFVKLVFAVEDGKKWDGNIYNTQGEQSYKYTLLNEPYTVNGRTYDSTVTVIQKDEPTSISQDYQVEVYAKNIGLIYKHYLHLETSWGGVTINAGVDYTYSIISWGN